MEKSNKHLKQIEATFKNMNTETAQAGLDLLAEAYFLKETMTRLKEEIQANSVVSEMQQGSYSIQRTSPAIKTYNTTLANYNKIMKQIIDLLPNEATRQDGEALLKFIAEG